MPKRTKKEFSQPRFFTSPVVIDGNKAVVSFPKAAFDHIKAGEAKTVHWTITNGIIQVSGKEPQIVIPLLASVEEFQAQK